MAEYTRSVPRLAGGETRFRIHQVPPLTKRARPTYVVRDHLHHEPVGAADTMREAAAICALLSSPADLALVRDAGTRQMTMEMAL